MRDEKILLIDDQHSHLRMMKKMLKRYGGQSVTVDSAEEAELLSGWNSDFCALITDLKMPWLDAVEFCKNTKEKYSDLKINALSGNLQLYGRNVLDDTGFDGIYQKPVSFQMIEDILTAIEKSPPNISTIEDHPF